MFLIDLKIIKDPISSDYMLNLINDGIILYFDSKNQRLKVNLLYLILV